MNPILKKKLLFTFKGRFYIYDHFIDLLKAQTMFRNLIIFSMLFLGLMSCKPETSTQEKESLIWLDVYSRYLETDQEYKVEFTFLKGDTLPAARPFQLDGEVRFDERLMDPRELSVGFIRYQLDYDDVYKERLPIRIQDKEIKWKSFALNFPKTPDFELQNGESTRIVFQEALSLQTLEALVAIVNDENGQTASVEIKGAKEVKEMVLGPDVYQKLAPGKWEVYLVFKRKGVLLDGNKTINYLMEYYSEIR